MMFVILFAIFILQALEAAAGGIPKAAFRDRRWERQWVAPRDGSIKLHIALRQDDGGVRAEQKLMSISDPDSPHFRHHLESDEAPYLSTPGQGTVHAVESWLWQHGLLQDATLSGGIFEIDTTIRQAERLLNTTYFYYSDGISEVIRTELFYLPDVVVGHIDFVAPTTSFPRPSVARMVGNPRSVRSVAQASSEDGALKQRASCGANDDVTPTCVRQVYNVNYQAKPSRVTFAVYGTEKASFSNGDLQTYLQRYNSAAAGAKYTVIGSGDPSEGSPGTDSTFETALDTQTALGLAWPAQGVFYNNGGVFGPNAGQTYDRFVTFLNELINNKTVPSVVSFSESMPEDMMDPAYARRVCNMMAQVGTRGVSLLFSSGDNGPNGDQPSGTHNAIFEPEFPASCPWVTAVGGTTNLADETGATQSTIPSSAKLEYTASGGGFSNLFSAPGYQKSAVDNYTSQNIQVDYSGYTSFNPKGRGIPDISAFSTNVPTVVYSVTFPIGGTSASTPLWAGIVALLNDYEASKGRPPLGFLNPWLYNLTSGLKDITTGGNNVGACNLAEGCTLPKTLGFNVTSGWDPVTGLGSPNFGKLTAALDASAKIKRDEITAFIGI